MEAGILLTSHPDPKDEPYPHQAIHARVTREILEAEELGFDSIWIAEHHFSNKYGILPDPFSHLSYLFVKRPVLNWARSYGCPPTILYVLWRS